MEGKQPKGLSTELSRLVIFDVIAHVGVGPDDYKTSFFLCMYESNFESERSKSIYITKGKTRKSEFNAEMLFSGEVSETAEENVLDDKKFRARKIYSPVALRAERKFEGKWRSRVD